MPVAGDIVSIGTGGWFAVPTINLVSIGTHGWWQGTEAAIVVGAAPGITIVDDSIGLSTAIPVPGMTISDVNPTVIMEQ